MAVGYQTGKGLRSRLLAGAVEHGTWPPEPPDAQRPARAHVTLRLDLPRCRGWTQEDEQGFFEVAGPGLGPLRVKDSS